MKRLFFLFIIYSSQLVAQETTYNPFKQFSPSQTKSDLAILASTIQSVHPSIYRYITKDSITKLFQFASDTISHEMTELELHILARKILQPIKCGHTTAMPSAEWYSYIKKKNSNIPLLYALLKNRLYITKYLRQDSLIEIGSEVLAIDQIPVSTLLKEMRSIQERDGLHTSYETARIEVLFNTYYLFLYPEKDSNSITLKNKNGDIKTIKLKAGITWKYSKRPRDKSLYTSFISTKYSSFYIKKSNPTVAVLDINSFYRKGFKSYYKKIFKEINELKINHLIIDVRKNGGGYFLNGTRLLEYLLDEKFETKLSKNKGKIKTSSYLYMAPVEKATQKLFGLMPDKDKSDPKRNYVLKHKPIKKNHFEGKIYLLIDGRSFSTSSYLATQLRYRSDAIVIGDEVGGGEIGSNAILSYKLTLPETKVRVVIPHYFWDHDITPTQKGRGVMPDHRIEYTLEERLQKIDKALNKALELVNNNTL